MIAAAAAVPVPGLDWAVDAALLARMVPAINKEFGLTPKQIEGLDVHSHAQVHKAVALVGSALIGRLITREALLVALRVVGVRAGRRLRVIWLDAHADFNTAATSPSGNMHGMPLAALCQEAPGPVAAVARPGTLSSEDLRLMGIRSVDEDEARAISRLGGGSVSAPSGHEARRRPRARHLQVGTQATTFT